MGKAPDSSGLSVAANAAGITPSAKAGSVAPPGPNRSIGALRTGDAAETFGSRRSDGPTRARPRSRECPGAETVISNPELCKADRSCAETPPPTESRRTGRATAVAIAATARRSWRAVCESRVVRLMGPGAPRRSEAASPAPPGAPTRRGRSPRLPRSRSERRSHRTRRRKSRSATREEARRETD